MSDIIPLSGAVKFQLTLDPGVWIFDERKIDLKTYFDTEQIEVDEIEQYSKAVAEHFSREIKEGAQLPKQGSGSQKKYEKEKLMTGTFGIKLKPFILNAEPEPHASKVVISTTDSVHSFSIEEAFELIAAFSNEGKPLREDGPIHILYPDGSNRSDPIRNVRKITIS
ncbi:peptidyl-prolyl cis-trans isomerase [Jeotgalibacillus sp. R-1-5s-1]|uniref:peptidyl-prolyl cis-trans isomerase n=1 Tax=Jeotgalibacillus sp. R-1-5s-1 TaxID=2555897 RepID=UPI00106AFCAA|nr:peptidyl-prolyl cis-trans isomerase [Jeotgalibacillus sp. R-1-5s-1]TFE03619.1 peptidyl-prolyl cis-trans isomerase [Jeotgalibacillus sp. R-1-5s-1]